MSQAELLVMLYRGAMRHLHEGIAMTRRGDHDQGRQRFEQARRIVVQLCGTLNRDPDSVGEKLAALYGFVIEQVTLAGARRDLAAAENCVCILGALQDGWESTMSCPGHQCAPVRRHKAAVADRSRWE